MKLLKKQIFSGSIVFLIFFFTYSFVSGHVLFLFDNKVRYLETKETNLSHKTTIKEKILADSYMNFNMDISGEGAIVTEINTDQVMYHKNAFEVFYPASTTKIMTLLVAIENGNLDEVVTVCDDAARVPRDSSLAYISPGDQLTLRDLLYGLMIPSGNDAAVAIACHIGGSEEQFVAMMNEKARKIGTLHTNFMNPHGYHHPEHYTTPYDLALIMEEGAKFPEFRNIIGATVYETTITNQQGIEHARIWHCQNRALLEHSPFYIEEIVGSKTGFTSEARHTLVSLAEKNGYEYVAVIFKGDQYERYVDTKTLFDKAFETTTKVLTSASIN